MEGSREFLRRRVIEMAMISQMASAVDSRFYQNSDVKTGIFYICNFSSLNNAVSTVFFSNPLM